VAQVVLVAVEIRARSRGVDAYFEGTETRRLLRRGSPARCTFDLLSGLYELLAVRWR
jgi:hypothetical protein